MATRADLTNELCSICFDSQDFRVLGCGHAFCIECIMQIHFLSDETIPCPYDRIKETNRPSVLPTPVNFTGRIFNIHVKKDEQKDFNKFLDDLVQQRKQTIKDLNELASFLKSSGIFFSVPKAAGGFAGVAGSLMAVSGVALSITGIGAVVGVPLLLAGAGIGVAGVATVGIATAIEQLLNNYGVQSVQGGLSSDHFKAEQVKILLMRAAMNPQFAQRWKIASSQLHDIKNCFEQRSKCADGTVDATGAVDYISGEGLSASVPIVDLALAAAIIPLDLTQMIITSAEQHEKDLSKVVDDIAKMAEDLDKQLQQYMSA